MNVQVFLKSESQLNYILPKANNIYKKEYCYFNKNFGL